MKRFLHILQDNCLRYVSFIAVLFFCVESSAQIYSYTNNTSGIPSFVDANAVGSNLIMVNGAAAPGSPCASGFSVTNFSSAVNYVPTLAAINIDITPNTGYQLNVTSFSADIRRSTTGPANVRYAYSIDGGANWIDEGADHAPNNAACGSMVNAVWNVAFSSPSLVKFRVYGFNASQTVGLFQLLNIVVSGTVTSCVTPSVQATDILLGAATGVTLNINWTDGDGSNRIVIINTINSFTNPVNGTSPPANSVYSGAGEQVVYNGNGNSVTVFGLTPLTAYWFRVYEYNCSGIGTLFLIPTATGNPATYSTSTASAPTDFFRSLVTGMWGTVATWESSPDNGITPWVTASLVPTNAAAAVTIKSGHTVTINTNATAPNLTVNGTLTFDNIARTITVVDLTVNAGGTFITQASGTASHLLTVGGDMINNGVFDMSRGGTTLVCIVSFNKNGNQNLSGTGTQTRFYKIDLNMGSSNNNVLDVTVSNFSATSPIFSESSTDNKLRNGTFKLSVPFTGTLFTIGTAHRIATNAGIWLNNSSITITPYNDTYATDGLLRISSGTLNVGTTQGNSVSFGSNSRIIIEGGTLNIAGRIGPQTAGAAGSVGNYSQSGGTVTLVTVNSTSTIMGGFDMNRAASTFNMSGGSIILRRVTSATNADYNNPSTLGTVTGGTVQFGDASTPNAAIFRINSPASLPNLLISNATAQATKPTLQLKSTLTATGNVTMMSGTVLDVSYNNGTNSFDILLAGNWVQDGTFTYRAKRVTFNGSNAQTIGGTASTVVFYDATVNKTSNDVTLNKPVTVNNSIALNSGRVFSTSTNILTLLSAATVTAVSNSSFVHGPVKKNGEAAFTFPVGKNNNYRPIGISADAPATFWTENFGTGCSQTNLATTYGWTVTNGANGASANQWFVSATEAGMGTGNCGNGCLSNGTLTNRTIHIANVSTSTAGWLFCPTGDCGAAYDASSAAEVTDRRIESPVINCTGKYSITLSFNYMENGQGTSDNATLWYYDGTTWSQLADPAKTTLCAGQGRWTAYSIALPASADNNPNVKIGFRWVNNGDGIGSDPSFAADDVSLSTSNAFTAEYFYANPQLVYGNSLAPTLNHISSCEYWILNRTSGTLNKNVTLSWDNTSCGVTLLSDLRVARYNTTLWADEGNTATTGSVVAGTVTSSLVTSFSPFTLSSVSFANPLPVELVNFNAVYNGTDVDVTWTTASETNNDYFTVLRSADGFSFYDLKTVGGAGNSSTAKYYAVQDKEPLTGLSYYQLKQTDFDGTSALSQIVPVSISHDGFSILFANATADGNIAVGISGSTQREIKFEILDVTGRIVQRYFFSGLSQSVVTLPEPFLSAGMYVLSVSDGDRFVSRKFSY